jgi:hypothetical protein
MPVNLTLSEDEARELIRALFDTERVEQRATEAGEGLEGDAPFLAMAEDSSRQRSWDSAVHKFMSVAATVGMAHLVEEYEDQLRWRFKSDDAQEILGSRKKDLERTQRVYLGWDLAQVHMDELGLDLGGLGEGDPETNPELGDALLLQMNLADIYQDYIKTNGRPILR